MNIPESYLQPLPEIVNDKTTKDYHIYPIDSSHPLFDEPLVDCSTYGLVCESYYGVEKGNPPYNSKLEGSLETVWLRRSVAELLQNLNTYIQEFDLELVLWDGYRSVECQQALWDFFAPDFEEKELVKYVSDPRGFDMINWQTWPTHTSGGSVDLTLRTKSTGEYLDMGGAFDEMSEVSHTRNYEKDDSSEAQKNRRILYWLMRGSGFTNYPHEWWHFDFGNQAWSMCSQMETGEPIPAFYGLALSGAEASKFLAECSHPTVIREGVMS